MTQYTQIISNAFCEHSFSGNPAATIILDKWLPDDVMQAIAAQNNLPETTFLYPTDTKCEIRWFTPLKEVYMAGHATLAAAHTLNEHIAAGKKERISFSWRDGIFDVTREDDIYWMDFPCQNLSPLPNIEILKSITLNCVDAYHCTDTIIILPHIDDVISFIPNPEKLLELPGRGLAITASGYDSIDYVSRFFCPRLGVLEDPVTGSSHAILARYWAEKLNKKTLLAEQYSRQRGYVHAEVKDMFTRIGGRVRLFSNGTIHI
ncbi:MULTISPECIES: PhzF family phenazine biosynthesis protein [Dickeya]|uniref:PhzF family phenazine biosynthesis protein n=1 Tax=Dickeya TaxID=204037 RepID=UPI00117F3417|nr:PhzF family phenazine biosynthesis protein [Dickeya sp. ws52]TYL42518.1 PhzF family phenazine biosynthesis protein [Dickeya sp. ws52]